MWNQIKTVMVNIPNLPTMVAFRILRRAIQSDPDYAEGWQSNIAMAIYDQSRKHEPHIHSVIRRTERGDFDAILSVPRNQAAEGLKRQAGELDSAFCNQAAARFMQTCFGVQTRRLN
jgi:hypothetical protein